MKHKWITKDDVEDFDDIEPTFIFLFALAICVYPLSLACIGIYFLFGYLREHLLPD